MYGPSTLFNGVASEEGRYIEQATAGTHAFCYRFETMEDYKPFEIVSVLQGGRSIGITSAYDAAKYILEKWPEDEAGPMRETAKAILLKCLEGGCSTAVARVAFIEAAGEAGIYVDTTPRPPPTGKLQRWHKNKPRRRA